MNMIEVKTAELSGSALDWAVGKADGRDMALFIPVDGRVQICGMWSKDCTFAPSTNWSQCGPLIEKNEITIYPPRHMVRAAEGWGAQFYIVNNPKIIRGQTPLIAACRAIVAAKLGDTVSVPAELVEIGKEMC